MANVTLWGASYTGVGYLGVPRSGGGEASYFDVTDTTAVAADVAQGKLFHLADGTLATGTSTGGGGTGGITQDANGFLVLDDSGSAPNFVQGSFKTSSTTGAASTFTIPYTGSGYPIMLTVVIAGGMWNTTSGGNSDWVNSLQRYLVGQFTITKSEMNTVPTYVPSGSLTNNHGIVTYAYKGSTSDATSISFGGSRSSVVAYNNADAGTSITQIVRFKGNGKTVSYYVASNSYGLMPDTVYSYAVAYSS